MTNEEWLKSLSTEELAKFFLTFIPYSLGKYNIHYAGIDGKYYPNAEMAIEFGENWLKQEHTDDE